MLYKIENIKNKNNIIVETNDIRKYIMDNNDENNKYIINEIIKDSNYIYYEYDPNNTIIKGRPKKYNLTIPEYKKLYYNNIVKNNIDTMNKRRDYCRKYNIENKEKIKERYNKANIKINCPCGCIITKYALKKHLESINHKLYLEINNTF